MFGRKLKARRADLAQVLKDDITQPLDWEGWLASATTIDELHATCPHPGWLVYCAYFAELPLDRIYEAALAVARHAAAGDPRAPASRQVIEQLDELDGAALEQLIIDLEQRHPATGLLVELLPQYDNLGMWQVYDARDAVREQQRDVAPPDLTPFRAAPASVARDDADALVAAGYVCTVECVYHHWQKLREPLTVRAAAAASLLCGSFAGFHAEALAIEREIYRFRQ